MTIYRLDAVLRNTIDLYEVNGLLRRGEAQLDWSGVRHVDAEAVATLLDGLNLAADAEVLGLETMSEALAQRIASKLAPALPPPQRDRAVPPAMDVTPLLWQTPTTEKSEPVLAVPLTTERGPHAESTSAGRIVQESVDETAPVDGPLDANTPAEAPLDAHVPATGPGEPDSAGSGSAVSPPAPAMGAASVPPPRPFGPVLQRPTRRALRDELQQTVLRDLLGPAGGLNEEVAETAVRDRYLVGMLAPHGAQLSPEEDDDLAVTGAGSPEDGQGESGVPAARSMAPASFGFTCSVSGETTALVLTARWGRYHKVPSETLVTKTGAPRQVWRREQVEYTSRPIPLAEGALDSWQPSSEQPEVYVQGLVRRYKDTWIVSLFLVNSQKEPRTNKDLAWLFQAELAVAAPDGAAIFCSRPHYQEGDDTDPAVRAEQQALAMTYRRRLEFAIGHGISVQAETAPGHPGRAVRVSTSAVPAYEVPRTDAPTPDDLPGLAALTLDMKVLADTPVHKLQTTLAPLAESYALWIAGQRQRLDHLQEDLEGCREAAEATLERCAQALSRIEDGIALLTGTAQAAQAFAFMNRAMWLQRTHALLAEERRRHGSQSLDEIDVPVNRSWRPFQLAFILINLPGITDLAHPDRAQGPEAIADLLWFPTGGGKTEAYLGLTAYTLAIRRLQGTVGGRDGENGVAVLMRYTLRLLTLQQTQRAAALICACESIRRAALASGDRRFGTTPFRIGLWVGQRTTPNKTAQAEEYIKDLRSSAYKGKGGGGSGSPAQITNCPWCGTAIDPKRHIKVDPFKGGRGRTLIYCGDPAGTCPFSEREAPNEGLPVVVVDEEIYRLLPNLVIATVDKFAQMPWNGATEMLFGQVTGYCTRHGFRSADLEDSNSHPGSGTLPRAETRPCGPLRPPDLIVQDELHLISGPLGTLVALYETAVDRLASWTVDGQTVRPKVVASTATIRQARDQVHSLFMRRVAVFPPQGIDVEDNFFSLQRAVSDAAPGRLYMGICAPGKRLKSVLIRVYVAYMAAAWQLFERYGAEVDPWLTLVGYFNSMRELGGMRRLVDDDVRVRLQRTEERGLARRRTPIMEELTSRRSSEQIPELLDRMEQPFDPEHDLKRAAKGEKAAREKLPALDVLLATNMISVGVDIKRLGLMVVAGQPKSTSEYIQATSRVGRSFPGLVCTVYNWARPRDLSHYEMFEHYHATFYQHVEPLSITPFASRAIDRGLSALLVSLVRLAGSTFNDNKGAARITRQHAYVAAARAAITARAAEINAAELDNVQALLEARLDHWLTLINAPGPQALGYRTENDGVTKGLLVKAGLGKWESFTTLNSLRDVEPSVNLILDEGSSGEVNAWLPTMYRSDERQDGNAEVYESEEDTDL